MSAFNDCLSPTQRTYKKSGLALLGSKHDQQEQLHNDVENWLASGHSITTIKTWKESRKVKKYFYDDVRVMDLTQWVR